MSATRLLLGQLGDVSRIRDTAPTESRVLGAAVDVIATSPQEIWTTDADDYSDEACSLILEVGQRLRASFPEGASATLVTKVVLGTFGCVPAFDFYFKSGSGLASFDRSARATRPLLRGKRRSDRAP